MTRKSKIEKILMLNPYGKYLGYSRTNFIIRNEKKQSKEIPFFSVGEIVLQSGNVVSTGALVSAGFWGIDVLLLTRSGKPVGTFMSLDDYDHVKTRIAQYQAYLSDKRTEIAKQIVTAKLKTQNLLLRKYGLRPLEFPEVSIDRLMEIEGRFANAYFKRILTLFPEKIRPTERQGFKAYDGINNLLNLGYEILQWKVHRALIKAKLDPYLGFLHDVKRSRPSLVCDIEELYRWLIDDFVINFQPKRFVTVYEKHLNRKQPREYLSHKLTNCFVKSLIEHFDTEVPIQRITKRGRNQRLDTLINEECSLLAMYIRGERENWIPRIVTSN